MPTACLAARASLYLYGWNPLTNTRFRVDKTPQRLDRPPALPRGSHGGWLKSLTLSTSTASPGHGEVLEEVAAPAVASGPPVLERTRYISYELTRAGGGDAFSSYTVRPGTTPLTRTGVSARPFRAYVPMSGGSLQAPE